MITKGKYNPQTLSIDFHKTTPRLFAQSVLKDAIERTWECWGDECSEEFDKMTPVEVERVQEQIDKHLDRILKNVLSGVRYD